MSLLPTLHPQSWLAAAPCHSKQRTWKTSMLSWFWPRHLAKTLLDTPGQWGPSEQHLQKHPRPFPVLSLPLPRRCRSARRSPGPAAAQRCCLPACPRRLPGLRARSQPGVFLPAVFLCFQPPWRREVKTTSCFLPSSCPAGNEAFLVRLCHVPSSPRLLLLNLNTESLPGGCLKRKKKKKNKGVAKVTWLGNMCRTVLRAHLLAQAMPGCGVSSRSRSICKAREMWASEQMGQVLGGDRWSLWLWASWRGVGVG